MGLRHNKPLPKRSPFLKKNKNKSKHKTKTIVVVIPISSPYEKQTSKSKEDPRQQQSTPVNTEQKIEQTPSPPQTDDQI
jgi:hypothetical protein